MNATEQHKQAQHDTERAKQAAGQAVEKGKEAAGQVYEKGKQAAGAAAEAAKHAASAVGHQADVMAASVGQTAENAANVVRNHTPKDGIVGAAADKVAGALEQGGKYLQQQGLTGLADDLGEMIKRNPIPAMLVGVGLGILLARATSRS
jgi:hypothetical protein